MPPRGGKVKRATGEGGYPSGMKFWKKRPPEHRLPYEGPIDIRPIGFVQNGVPASRPQGWENVESEIHLLPLHEGRAAGLDAYSHLLIVFYMDTALGAPAFPEALTLASGNSYGIFATRSQLRPNHLGVSAVPLLRREGTVLHVRGLDAIDGTAVLDVKPYLPAYDSIPDAKIPG